MSLVHLVVAADNVNMNMTNSNHSDRREPGFSASQYREAMGPGYMVPLFREQQELTGRQRPEQYSMRTGVIGQRARVVAALLRALLGMSLLRYVNEKRVARGKSPSAAASCVCN